MGCEYVCSECFSEFNFSLIQEENYHKKLLKIIENFVYINTDKF